MGTFVALLRAVNVGGTKLPMADLRALLEGLGLTDVRTYLQSGNAVFDARDDGAGVGARDRDRDAHRARPRAARRACSCCRASRWPTSRRPTRS